MKHLLRKWTRGHRALLKAMRWRELYAYLKGGISLDLVEVNPDSSTQSVLVVATHPGEEIVGCGAMMWLHKQRGDAVHVVYLTDGSRGTHSGRRDKSLILIREKEADEGLRRLQITDKQFWRFADGKFEVNQTTIGLLKSIIEKHHPDVIYIPWYITDDQDQAQVMTLLHDTVLGSKEVRDCEVWQYEVWSPLYPNRLVAIDQCIHQKKRALEAHVSQQEVKHFEDGAISLNVYRGASVGLTEAAEAFFALPLAQFMHFCEMVQKDQPQA